MDKKDIFIRRLLPLFCGSFLLASLGNACNGSHSAQSAIPDTLKVAVELSSMTLSTTGDTISGFSFELLQDICNDHGLPYDIKIFNNIHDAFHSPDSNTFDVFVSNLPVTANLKERHLATQPLYTDKLILVQNKEVHPDSLISQHFQLGGKPVWIINSGTIAERLDNLSEEIGENIIVVKTEDISEEQLVILVALGEVPRAAVSNLTAKNLLPQYENLDISVNLSFNQFKAWLLNPNDSVLRDSLDIWLDNYKATEEYTHLLKKYNLD